MRALIAALAMLPCFAIAGPVTDAFNACHKDSQFAQSARSALEHGISMRDFAVENIKPSVFTRSRLDEAMDLVEIGYNYRIVDAYGYAFARCIKQKARAEPFDRNPKLPGE